MHSKVREREVRLELVSALARSQRAVASMLESVADICASSPAFRTRLQRNQQVLEAVQHALTRQIETAARPPRAPRRAGRAQPWLSSGDGVYGGQAQPRLSSGDGVYGGRAASRRL
ncbi:hypothetical protein IDH44_23625 [Paenibacillus sp. IB182496]|uniref:Uncharacterized protein n=1 Tax=Paenibacillus sabuli TaxID=2772509 RepID=A0A927BXJ7_9BACL|nr:hypothetical protein [Paenibacillus sabuli]MBD2848197.1 hypothetical protein [Paenibacillus sabuli]